MAKTILTDIDLQQNEVQNAVLENRATAPTSPKPGQQYFDTTDNTVKTYNGTEWTSGGSGGGTTITVDTALSTSSTNPVQNKVVTNAINGKQATLVSGTTIKTINGESVLGSGNITISGGGGGGGGLQNLATVEGSLSILGAATTSIYSTSVGSEANASEDYSVALGTGAIARGFASTALGQNANASEEDAIAFGTDANASAPYSIAFGMYANASGESSTALGQNAEAYGEGSTALGTYANASAPYSIAFGMYANASGVFSTALGAATQVHDDGVASIGANYIYDEVLTTQLYVIAKGSPLSQQYLGGKAGLAYAIINNLSGVVNEGKIISFETLFANGINFSPSSSN